MGHMHGWPQANLSQTSRTVFKPASQFFDTVSIFVGKHTLKGAQRAPELMDGRLLILRGGRRAWGGGGSENLGIWCQTMFLHASYLFGVLKCITQRPDVGISYYFTGIWLGPEIMLVEFQTCLLHPFFLLQFRSTKHTGSQTHLPA